MIHDTRKRRTKPWIWIIALLAAAIIILLIALQAASDDHDREMPGVSQQIQISTTKITWC